MQVLLPVDQSQYKGQPNKAANQFSEDSKETIKAEYKANLDGNGKYVGTRYEASKLFYGKLTPPAISVVYNNVTYPNDNKDHYESYSLFSGGDPVVGQILFGDVMNIKPQTLNGKIVFTIYKGEGEGIESWQRVSGYDPGRNAYDNPSIFGDGEFRIEVQTSGVPALTSSNFIRRNAKNNPPSAVGMYHIVPGYRYANQYNLGNYDFILLINTRARSNTSMMTIMTRLATSADMNATSTHLFGSGTRIPAATIGRSTAASITRMKSWILASTISAAKIPTSARYAAMTRLLRTRIMRSSNMTRSNIGRAMTARSTRMKS